MRFLCKNDVSINISVPIVPHTRHLRLRLHQIPDDEDRNGSRNVGFIYAHRLAESPKKLHRLLMYVFLMKETK
jgi:hypothetical protein